MTDRELLELAARAAGLHEFDWVANDGLMNVYDSKGRQSVWNPLTDDGDAFRLAARLHLHLLHNDKTEKVLWVSAVVNKTMTHAAEEFFSETDRGAATRRAIVRAAAEIGKGVW